MSKVWFITGSSRGLGLAIAETVLETGASIIATARTPSQLDPLVKKYGADKVLPIALDVTNNEQVLQAVKAGHDRFGRIDIVVNNAGYADIASIEDMTVESFRHQMDTNFMGVVYVTKAVLPILRKQGSGYILQVASLGSRVGSVGFGPYQSAKWAVAGFTTILAQEVAPFGIKVTSLEPGGMKTEWAGSSMKIPPVSEPYEQTVGAFAKWIRDFNPIAITTPKKVAQIILELIDEDEPPLRLLLGTDAVEYATKAAEALLESDKKWHDLSVSASNPV